MNAPPVCVCTRCGSAIEPGDFRCPVCYLAIPENSSQTDGIIRVRVLRCASCGAAMQYRVTVRAPQCAFCGGTLKLEEQIDRAEQTQRHLPFTVDRARAVASYRQWISRQGFFRPFKLASTARLESLKPLWWVGWVVDADALVTWTADTNAGAELSSWAPHSGELQDQFRQLVIPATRGLSFEECADLIRSYVLKGPSVPAAEADGDVLDERFDIPRSAARTRITRAIQFLAEARVLSRQLSRVPIRNFHSAVLLRRVLTQRVAFPAYVLAYRHRRQLYRTVISGQDANCVLGQAPRSYAKLILLILVVITLAVLLFGAQVITALR